MHWIFHGFVCWVFIFLSIQQFSLTNLCLLFSWELKDISFSFELPARAVTHEAFVLPSAVADEIQHSDCLGRHLTERNLFLISLVEFMRSQVKRKVEVQVPNKRPSVTPKSLHQKCSAFLSRKAIVAPPSGVSVPPSPVSLRSLYCYHLVLEQGFLRNQFVTWR